MYAVSLSGFVEARDIRERTDRFVLRVTQMESPRSQMKLQRVRLSVRNGTAPDVGSFVELKARLQPPLAPLRPGSYDFGRDMFFQGIGASGFVTGAIKTLEAPRSGGLSLRYAATRQQQIKQSRGKRRRRRPFFDRIYDGQLRDQRQQRAYREENHSGYDRHVIAGYRQHVAKPGALASLVAGLATTPYAAFHFHRVTPYGVLANLAAMPAVSAVVMPAGMLGLVAMPFGFDGVFWRIMGSGIDWMIVVTQWVAVPGAIGRMADFGIGPLIAASIGIVLLGLLRTPLRWLGAAVLLLSVIWAVTVPQPEIMISADGHNVGVRGRDGRLHIIRSAKDAFLLKEWLAADADARLPTDSSLAEGVSEMAGGGFVALALRPEALADDCERAALVVTTRPAPASCPSPVMSGDRLRSQGAMTLRRTAAGFAIDAVRPKGVTRPWSPGPAGDSETEAALAPRSKVPRAVDATPAEADQQAED
jgi:Competence protein/Domain of unknown function (DUF4131)